MSRFGWDVVTYYSLPYRDRVNPAMAIRWGHSTSTVQYSTVQYSTVQYSSVAVTVR